MLRLRDSLLLAFAGAACWAMLSGGQACNNTFSVGGGGSFTTTGFGGTTQGIGGINYASCDECLDPMTGAPANQCESAVSACDGDAACRALLACVEHGAEVTTTPGTGGTMSSGGGSGGTSTSLGGGGTSASGGGGGGGNAGGATASSAAATTGAGSGGATGATSHGPCDTSLLGACCILDCAAALGTPEASRTRFLQRTRCLDCATCKAQCLVGEAFCATLQDGGEANCGR
jgi:hypothetical protein